jgi:6-phosphogluconate dehydrogenase
MEKQLEVGFVGLGRMGANMCSRILDSKTINLHIHNRSENKMKPLIDKGATGHISLHKLVEGLWQKQKIVWLMLPSGDVTENHFQELYELLGKEDIIIDGGNSNFKDSIRRSEQCREKGIHFIDTGVSGGIIAADTGYPMMSGGESETYEILKPLYESFAYPKGHALVGPNGAGHYTKMIHNAVEYGMMQAISEGFDLLENGRYKEQLNLPAISQVWNNGCVVSSFLMEMVDKAFQKDPKLGYLEPHVDDNGEGRWSSIEAMEYSVPFVVNTYALHARYISRDKNSYTFRMLAAMRQEFGGHGIKKNE